MNSRKEFSEPTKSSDLQFAFGQSTPQTRSEQVPCIVFRIESYLPAESAAPEKYITIGDLTAKWDKHESRRAAMEEARRWAATERIKKDGDSVKTYRLKNGWSQVQLAQAIGTSQPHIARIERGTENLTIDTCRRLAEALGVDMNTLDQALRRQQHIAERRMSR